VPRGKKKKKGQEERLGKAIYLTLPNITKYYHLTRHIHCPQEAYRLMRIKWELRANTHHCFCSFDFISSDIFILSMFQKQGFLSFQGATSYSVRPCHAVIHCLLCGL
jgi:hypothetical protein